MATLTTANSQLILVVAGLFTVPTPIQGYGVDEAFLMEAVETAETLMGIDAKMSAGWIAVSKNMQVTLQADSDSIPFFESWYSAQDSQQDLFFATGSLTLPSLSKTYVMAKGVLRGYTPIPEGRKVLQPRRFRITWESVLPGPSLISNS